MTKHPHKPSSDLKSAADAEKTRLDALLNEALEATFPASDPLAILEPAPGTRHPGNNTRH